MSFVNVDDAALSRGRSFSQSFVNFRKAASRRLHTRAGKEEDTSIAGVGSAPNEECGELPSRHPSDLQSPQSWTTHTPKIKG